MAHFRKVDPQTGLFVADVILDTQPIFEDGTPDPAYIDEPIPQDAGFMLPRWDQEAGAWVEGGTPPAPVTPEPTLEERQDQVEAALMELAAIVAGGM